MALLAFALALAAAMVRAQPADEIPHVPSILVLLSRAPETALEQRFLEGFARALRTEQPAGAPLHNLHIEFLNLVGAPPPGHLDEMAAWLRRKHASRKFDVVLVHGAAALQFALAYPSFSHGATLVVAGVEADALAKMPLPAGSVAAPLHWDVRGTLDLAWRLLPGTERVVVVAGATAIGRSLADAGIAHIRKLRPETEIKDLTGATLEAALSEVSAAGLRTFILVIGFAVDGRGRTLNQLHAFEIAAQAAGAPMFTINAVTIGLGSVGGHMVDFSRVGANAAQQVIAVLRAEGNDAGPARVVAFDSTRRVIDETAARRWKIDLDRIPAGVELVNRSPSLWRDYRQQILGVALSLLLLAGVMAGLLFERMRRLRAEAEAKARLSQLLRVDRASAMGQLSAALAHQLNQPLGTLRNYAEGAERLMDTSPLAVDRLRGAIASIRTESQRAADVVQRVRDMFSAGDSPYLDVDLASVVRDTVELTRHEANARGIALVSQLPEHSGPLQGDPVQLQQAVLNLLMNGLDACAGRPDARVEVVLQENTTAIELRVSDNGCGMSAALVSRMFEPFFTTKQQGVGMGLALVRRIVEAHGGRVDAQLRGEGGMVVCIQLPREIAEQSPSLPVTCGDGLA